MEEALEDKEEWRGGRWAVPQQSGELTLSENCTPAVILPLLCIYKLIMN